MDTSETYIKMCDCEEIQGLRPISHYNRTTHKETADLWEDGDWFSADNEIYTYGGDCYHLKRYDDENPDLGSAGYQEGDGGHVEKVIWLPRQDQLQEMIDEWWKENGNYGEPLIKGLYDFAMSFGYKPFRESELPIKSWEQLWLAFVMKEKNDKIWTSSEWVKDNIY